MPLLYTETVAIFLITLILFCLTRVFRAGYSKKYIFLSGFILGYLALTKVVFGYVLLVLLIGCGLLWLLNKRRANYKRAVIVLGIAFLTTLPYLIYTYNLTGRIFYWGTSAGINLYWMSSPYQGEYGNWFSDMDFQSDPMPSNKTARYSYEGGQLNLKNRINNTISGIIDSVRLHHQKDFEEINKYKGLERDDAFRRIAFKNIRSHPMKYLINCISNVGRMLFNYPYSYTIQKPGTLLRIPLNGIVVVLALFSLIPTLINWKKVSFSMRFMLFFTFIYLGGSTLESGEFRMFTIIVPVLLVWIAMVIQKSVKINLVFDQTRE